jgi:peptidoglycan/xylan/chitin deacetylase (PgdA/CDA1 family)
MADIDTALAASRDAVDQMIRAGEQSGTAWLAPRAPGKWSPSQIVEHIARGLDEAANAVAGRPSLPMPPAVVRPIARFMFKRVLRKAAFPKGFKAHKAMNPASGPATPAEGRIRLETAHQKWDEVCRRIGRAPLNIDRVQVVTDRFAGMSLTEVAKKYRVSRATVCRLVNEVGGQKKVNGPHRNDKETTIAATQGSDLATAA